MVSTKTFSFGALIAGVSATAAPGFPFQTSTTLNVTYGSNNVSPGGELVPRAELASQPSITTPVWRASEDGSANGVLLMVDSDVPRNGTRVELLHWLVSGVTVSDGTLSFPDTAEAEYRSPNPPVGDSPHAYTFIVFEEPSNFSVPAQFQEVLQSRVFFNTSNFVAAAGLGQPIAAQWIQVQNLTGTPTTTFPPPRATNGTGTGNPTSTGTPEEFPGVAAGLMAEKMLWVTGLAALLSGVAAFAL